MSMMQWIKNLVQDDQSLHIPAPENTQQLEEEAGGLNFKSAINAHISWKQRLTDYINGNLEEKLDHETVVHDQNCALGKWIYGQGEAQFGKDPLFQQLKLDHQKFHSCAGDIISEVNNGNRDQANKLILEGDYPRVSTQVTSQLAQLYLQFRNS